jgi:hypothetical protein
MSLSIEPSELEARKYGICWRCRGIDMYFEDFAVEEPSCVDPDIRVLWRDIRTDCALCSELKTLLDSSGSPILDILHINPALYASSRRVKIIAEYIGSPKKRAWDLFTHINTYLVDRIWLVLNNIARHVEAELRDLSLVRSWIHECQGAHKEFCGYQRSSIFPLTKAIEVSQNVSRKLLRMQCGWHCSWAYHTCGSTDTVLTSRTLWNSTISLQTWTSYIVAQV